jgi:hypothetical protein
MNERIQELAEQAGISYLSSVHPDMWEKFAELIVRECTNIVLHYTDVDEGVAVAKKHFGVEL